MAPPHEIWGEAFARAMVDSDLEAMCADPGEGWRHELARGDPLADWWPAGVVAGLPVVPRSRLSTPPADLRFRAYLGQPIVLYGHHWDLRYGLDALAGPAAEVGQIDEFEWTSLERIARSCVSTRARDGVLEVRMHARRAEIEIPPETSHLRVTLPPGATGAPGETVTWRHHEGAGIADLHETIRLAGASTIELRLVHQAVADGRTACGRRRLWPLVRRGLTEGRDRLGATLARGRARGPRRAGS